MRRMISQLFLFLLLGSITPSVFAATPASADPDRYEHRGQNRKDRKDKDRKDKDRKDKDRKDKDRKDKKHKDNRDKKDRHDNHRYDNRRPAPAYGPSHNPPRYDDRRYHNQYGHHYQLDKMVRKATKGGKDIQIWRVSPDTYLVRYRKGKKLYTRYIYPYSNTIGRPNQITVNWHPLRPWTLIPPIQLNLNF